MSKFRGIEAFLGSVPGRTVLYLYPTSEEDTPIGVLMGDIADINAMHNGGVDLTVDCGFDFTGAYRTFAEALWAIEMWCCGCAEIPVDTRVSDALTHDLDCLELIELAHRPMTWDMGGGIQLEVIKVDSDFYAHFQQLVMGESDLTLEQQEVLGRDGFVRYTSRGFLCEARNNEHGRIQVAYLAGPRRGDGLNYSDGAFIRYHAGIGPDFLSALLAAFKDPGYEALFDNGAEVGGDDEHI